MTETAPLDVNPSRLRIGVTMSVTGPSELDWTPVRRALELWPARIGGLDAEVDFADDEADPDRAAGLAEAMVRRGAHALVQFSLSGPAFAVAGIAHENRVLHFAMSPIEAGTEQAGWTFRLSPKAALMVQGLLDAARSSGYRRIGFIGSADNYGTTWDREVTRMAPDFGIKIGVRAAYSRTDDTLADRVVAEFVAGELEAIVIAGPGRTAPVPQQALRRGGYTGPILQTFGADMQALAAGDPQDFDGTIMPTGAGSASHLLPETAPQRVLVEGFEQAFAQRFGAVPRSQAAISTLDALLILQAIAARARSRASPRDVAAFRTALRDALFAGPVQTGSGLFTYTHDDRFGLGADARQLIALQGGVWQAVRNGHTQVPSSRAGALKG